MQLEGFGKPGADEHLPAAGMPRRKGRGPELQVSGGIALQCHGNRRDSLDHEIVWDLGENSGTHAGKTDSAQGSEHVPTPSQGTCIATVFSAQGGLSTIDDYLAYSTQRVSRTTVMRICPG